jgi:TPP-dependent 2-oxoacid decarboxylase
MNTHTSQDTPFIPAPRITTVVGYLLTRLAEAGLASVFGVPGDYNLGLLDAIAGRPDLAWIGMATEQGAGYAADSYARLRGIGALVTTLGVGELSALNAIAGAYAESVPVVQIVGTPALAARETGATLHHNLPGRDYGHFARMAAEVTAAQADLRPDTAPEEIDRVLGTALRTSRPVYLTIPADVAGIPVLAPMGLLPRAAGDADPAVVAAFTGRARRELAAAASVSLLVGHLAARYRVTAQVRDLAIAGDLPVAVLPEAKGDFPESDPRFAGLYVGPDPYPSAKRARVAVEDADVLITVGVTLADTVLGGGHGLPEGRRIELEPGQACIDGTVYPGLGLRESLAILAVAVRQMPSRTGALAHLPPFDAASEVRGGPLTQASLWARLQDFLLPGDLLVADQGTTFYGAAGLTLPDGARLVGQPLWASIGWTLPAALGASLGAPDRRVVLIVGDGAMQQTAAELGTLLGQGLAPVVIVINNHGYTVERAIHQPSAGYHEIPAWDWTALPGTVAPASSPVALRVTTSHELAWALNAAHYHAGAGRPVLIEAVLGAEDAPPLLQDLARALAASHQ